MWGDVRLLTVFKWRLATNKNIFTIASSVCERTPCDFAEVLSAVFNPIDRSGAGAIVILHSFDEDTSTAHLSLAHSSLTSQHHVMRRNLKNATITFTKRKQEIAKLFVSLVDQVET